MSFNTKILAMKILLVANGNYKHNGARQHEQQKKLYNGLVRNGHNVLFFSNRDAARNGIFLSSYFGKEKSNKDFLQICKNFQPELIICAHADIITPDTLLEARKILPEIKMADFNVDALFIPHNIKALEERTPLFDATFITTAGPALKKFSHKNGVVCYVPNMVDLSIEWPRCHERSDQENDMFWAMRSTKKSRTIDNPRTAPALFLENSGKIKISYHGMNGKPDLLNANYYQAISNAKMGLNNSLSAINNADTAPQDLYLYSSDRISQYIGSGLLTFIAAENCYQDLLTDGEDFISYTCKEDLLEKAIYYKENDNLRKKIAGSGWEKYSKNFNEHVVANYIIETTLSLPYSQSYNWPTEKF